jgi:hypothetical protein
VRIAQAIRGASSTQRHTPSSHSVPPHLPNVHRQTKTHEYDNRPLAGIVIGHALTRSWQRKQWVLDNKKQEYRELLTTLTRCHAAITRLTSLVETPMVIPDRNRSVDYNSLVETHAEALNVIRDRIFIADNVKRMDILNRWLQATKLYQEQQDVTAFRTRFEAISDLIVSSSARELKAGVTCKVPA